MGFLDHLNATQQLLFFSAVMVNSTLRVLSGRGVTWKGRSYGLRPQP